MNEIIKKPLSSIGYQFIPAPFLPDGKDEYYLRNQQNKNGIRYRNLTAYEIEVLVRNNNTSDNWNNIHVSDAFNPELVKHCKFFGLVRVGKLESISLEYHNVTLPVGLYNSTIISCDFGDNVIVNNVKYLSHYIIGNEVILLNVDEVHTTDHSKFGNGILKEGEDEAVRVWVEVCNENAGRKILPFEGMLPGDAYLWSRHRDDEDLMERFKEFTEKRFDNKRGYYGVIGDRTVVKNTGIIKDVWVGTDAYIKGANKLKNLTIISSPEAPSQIGEGCELVNGIISKGCRLFYGVKAVRFIMGSNSQLKYGARLINSFLGANSTISCCEVLNSLIFPGHEQHHNNSFLCAALVMGQSNIAAGATLGSNHNSRAADGELIAARGFWPGLCVSIKHNSKFASFTLLAKGDYSYELNIPLPFSLVSNDVSNNQLSVMPAYWFMYNLYALARNAGKYVDRDKRTNRVQLIEYDFLAPDSVNEIFTALELLKKLAAQSQDKTTGDTSANVLVQAGETILEDDANLIRNITINDSGFENSSRPVSIAKVGDAYRIYKDLVLYYSISNLISFINEHNFASFDELMNALPAKAVRLQWTNVGGQLIPSNALTNFLDKVRNKTIQTWDEVHEFYGESGKLYKEQKVQHAYASLLELQKTDKLDAACFKKLLIRTLEIREWMVKNIFDSRAKDYQNEFRKMVYGNEKEMEVVTGRLEDNVFISQQKEEFKEFRSLIETVLRNFGL
jgi:signal peptidase I